MPVLVEAFVSAVGMGDDINAIIRTCPAPRDGESELACQVNGAILGAGWAIWPRSWPWLPQIVL